MTPTEQDKELRKAIEDKVAANGRYVIESITLIPSDVKLQKLNKKQTVDAIIDAVIAALPEEKDAYRDGSNLTYEIFGYNSAISEIKSILEEAKTNK